LPCGTQIGPYEITEFIGAGGMGEVYRAHDSNLNRVVALKLLPADLADDPEQLRRFEEEARAASGLNHPSIVTIYDAGRIGAYRYISMELVVGETLREILGLGPIPLRRALRIAGQVSDALAKAHEAGLVHRDLKPENIKVTVDNFAKILDFGLAKRVSFGATESSANTRTAIETSPGVVLGTVGYMSPEQASGGRAEFPSDQFSFGLIVYEMLTGRRAFDRPSAAETLSAIIKENPPPIVDLNPTIPPPVRWIVERCLAKDPLERYALTRDLARDIASVREHLGELLASRRTRPSKRATGDASIAVLPVVNLSTDGRGESLADAMTDALITELTRCERLHVISRTTSMVYKGRQNSAPDIAEALGVEWILLGSVARIGSEIRVSVQLVDANSDENRWARSHTAHSRNALAAITEVACAAAASISTLVANQAASFGASRVA
jgi:serine/threonine protein kinase